MRPNTRLGQHFLKNPKIIEAIIKSLEIITEDTILEIGPGTGVLTDSLVATNAKILAVEKDEYLAEKLQERYRDSKNIEIITGDILTFNFNEKTRGIKNLKVVGNLPYYLSSHLLRIAMTQWENAIMYVFMVQKEVAQRIVSRPPDMNMLGLLVQINNSPKIIRNVSPGNFNPPPKVDSAVIKILPKNNDSVLNGEELQKTIDLGAKGFKNPRKMLGNKLPKELLAKSGIDPKRRAETLTIQEWLDLSRMV